MNKSVFLSIAVLLSCAPLFAQEDADESRPPQPPSKVQWSLGIGAFSSPRPYVGAENSQIVAPLIEVTYKKIYVQGIQAGYRFFDTGKFALDARAGIVFNGLDPEDSEFLEGMNKRRPTIEGGFVFDWKPGKFRLSNALYTDLLGRSYGQQASSDFSRTWTFSAYRWGFTPSIGVVWQSSNFVDYYYGVTPEEARPGRPPFEGHSVINFRSSLFGYIFMTLRLRFVALVRVQRLDNEIIDSPIVDQQRGIFGLVGISYRMGRLPPRPSR
jgi:outer membrane protein